jgi:hypothetical protein
MWHFQNILSHQGMQISLHMLENQVQVLIVLCFDDRFELYYLWVVYLMQDSYLSICSLRIDIVLKRVEYFLKCVGLFWRFLNYFPNVPVSSTSEKLLNFEKLQNVLLNFFRHILIWKISSFITFDLCIYLENK